MWFLTKTYKIGNQHCNSMFKFFVSLFSWLLYCLFRQYPWSTSFGPLDVIALIGWRNYVNPPSKRRRINIGSSSTHAGKLEFTFIGQAKRIRWWKPKQILFIIPNLVFKYTISFIHSTDRRGAAQFHFDSWFLSNGLHEVANGFSDGETFNRILSALDICLLRFC